MTIEHYQDIVERLNKLEKTLKEKQKNSDLIFLDNQEFIQVMNISKRLAQRWRDTGLISYSMVGNKIYYSIKDIHTMLSLNYRKANNTTKLK
ncbi:MAG: DNA-binding protein [Bacteroidota bacterium]